MFPLVPRTTNVAALMGARTDPDALAWQMAVVGAGGTVSAPRLAIFSTMCAGIKSDLGITALNQALDHLSIYAGEDPTNGPIQAQYDFVAQRAHTLHSSPTFTANKGYTGDGTAAYIDTGYNPASGTNYKQNDAHYGVYVQTGTTQNTGFPCYAGNQSGSSGSNLDRNGSNFAWNIQNSNSKTFAFSSQVGLWVPERTGSLAASLYYDGAATSSADTTDASITVPNRNFYVLACNDAGGADLFNSGTVAAFVAGAHLGATGQANLYARIHAALNAISPANFP